MCVLDMVSSQKSTRKKIEKNLIVNKMGMSTT